MTTTLVLADDHVLFRQGLAALLGAQQHRRIVGQARDGEAVVRLAERLQPDIVALDNEMLATSGIAAAVRIQSVAVNTKVIVLSMYGDAPYQRRLFEAAALAYLLKNEAIEDLLDVVQACLRGEGFVSPSASQPVSSGPARSADVDKSALIEREIEVLRLPSEGRRTREIRDILGISAKTIETCRGRILLKRGITNLPGLVKFAIRAGIISPQR